MKRKDTKRYHELVENYCELANVIDVHRKLVKEHEDKAAATQEAIDNFKRTGRIDPNLVEEWGKSVIGMRNIAIGMFNRTIRQCADEIKYKRLDTILTEEYGEDLNHLRERYGKMI